MSICIAQFRETVAP